MSGTLNPTSFVIEPKITEIRWNAIQEYFLGNVEKCINYLNEALTLAKKQDQPLWVVQDILIDLRNQ